VSRAPSAGALGCTRRSRPRSDPPAGQRTGRRERRRDGARRQSSALLFFYKKKQKTKGGRRTVARDERCGRGGAVARGTGTGSRRAKADARAISLETWLSAHLDVRVSLRLGRARVFPGGRIFVHPLGGDVFWRFPRRTRAGLAVAVVPQQARDVHVAHRELVKRSGWRGSRTRCDR